MDLSNLRLSQYSQNDLSDWNKVIIEKYPILYTEYDEHNAQYYYCKQNAGMFDELDYCNLRNGFEFSQGWMKLVEAFSSVASDLVLHLRATVQPDAYIHASIFKQKFGCLRWQGRDNLKGIFSELFHGYVRHIEERSTSICEYTGERGRLRSIEGFAATLCDDEFVRICKERAVTPILDE